MKKIAKNILSGINLEENINVFAHKMMGVYNDYSFINLSMSYFTYYEAVKGMEDKDENLKDILEKYNLLIKNGIINKASGEECELLIPKVEELRTKVNNIMTGLTTYIDIFNVYEYCLNRTEYRFKEGEDLLSQSDEELTRQVMQYIVSDEDSVVINGKITEVIGQLPVRMTKSKFYEYVREGIKVYKGSEKASVDDFIYVLKTCGMLDVTPYIDLISKDVKEIYTEFKAVDFLAITEDKYYDLVSKLDFVSAYLNEIVSVYLSLGEILNDLYIILLSRPYKMEETEEEQFCINIIEKVNELFDVEDVGELYESLEDSFVYLEGKPEKYYETILKYEYTVDDVIENHRELLENTGLDKAYSSLDRIKLLNSGSIFIDFEKKNSEEADEDYIDSVTNKFIEMLDCAFKENNKIVNRAVMSMILASLPTFFNNVEQIQEYIYNSLSQCRDMAEKAAVIELLQKLVAEEM